MVRIAKRVEAAGWALVRAITPWLLFVMVLVFITGLVLGVALSQPALPLSSLVVGALMVLWREHSRDAG